MIYAGNNILGGLRRKGETEMAVTGQHKEGGKIYVWGGRIVAQGSLTTTPACPVVEPEKAQLVSSLRDNTDSLSDRRDIRNRSKEEHC